MFENKKVLILGLARSGYQAAKLLIKRNNIVYLNEAKSEDKLDKSQLEELKGLGVNLVLGSHPDDLLDDSFDYLIKNPGVPIDHKYVLKSRELGIEVINEVEMAYHLLPENVEAIIYDTRFCQKYEVWSVEPTIKDIEDDTHIGASHLVGRQVGGLMVTNALGVQVKTKGAVSL